MNNSFKLGLRGKTTIALGGLIFLVLSVISSISYWQSVTVVEQKVMELEQSKLSVLKHEIEGTLNNHLKNLLSLQDVPPVQAILHARANNDIDPVSGDSLKVWRNRLETIFSAFLDNHPEYIQIRYIDAAGKEMVRVEKSSHGVVTVAADSALQNKSDSDYVTQTLRLQAGEAFYSDVTLNREHGVIQVPHLPVLRMATPVHHDTNNKTAGLIVLNLSTNELFSDVRSDDNGMQRSVVDEKGNYIKHSDVDKIFGFERGVNHRFQDFGPELYEISKSNDHYIRHHDGHGELDGFQKIYFSPTDHSRYWLLTLNVPRDVVFSGVNKSLNKMLFFSLLIGVFSLLLIVWYVSRKIVTPVVNLATVAEQLQKGDLTVRVDEASTSDEFHTLYAAVNSFAVNQQHSTSQLKNEVDTQTRRLSAVIDTVVDGIITINEQGLIVSFNPAAQKIFGYSIGEVYGANVKMLMPEPYHSEHDGYLSNFRSTGEKKIIGIGREVTGLRKDGSTFPMELAVSEVTIDGIRHFVGITRDISERKLFEQQIIDEKKRLAAVIDNVVDGIITIGDRGEIETFNPAATSIFGYSYEEVLGENVKILMPEPYHSEHDGYLRHHITTGEKKVIGIGREVTGQRKDGSTFPMELAVSEVIIDGGRHFVGITRDITERKRVEQMQKEFVSTVSHELRTPLTSIRGSLGLILGGVTGKLPEKAKELLSIANNNSERLIHLINDILDMEKISAGKMHFDLRVTDLTPVVEQALEANRGYGDQLNVHFKLIAVPDDEVKVNIDEKRMAQMMSNLLSNAAKYSPADDQVDVSVETITKEKVRISVHDHGKGIPEEFKSRIFSKFSQADSSDTRQKGGTGLGLNITKAIVEEQGGSIGFDSGEGRGTTFYVDLPIWHEEVKVVESASEEVASDKPRVLIIEDDKDVSRLLSIMLEKEGYRFHQAFDYQEAVQKIEDNHYSAITLDLMIPGGSGITLLRELRENEATRELPVVVVSAKANEGKLEANGDAISVVNWIEKPINEERLLQSIRSGISDSAAEGGRILHVEDDQDISTIVDSLLDDECQVVHAASLKEAKQLLSSEMYDLVLLDIGLPDGSGLDLLPILSSKEYETPVIIFSAQDVSYDIAEQVVCSLVKSKTDNERLMQHIKSAINK